MPVWLGLDLAAIPSVGYFVRRTQRGFEDSRIPLLGVLGSFVFAAQMINFPVMAGTSGTPDRRGSVSFHAWAKRGHGGDDSHSLRAGSCFSGRRAPRPWGQRSQHGRCRRLGGLSADEAARRSGTAITELGGLSGRWLSLMAAALLAAVELSISAMAPSGPLFVSILGIHAVTGVAEGVITAVTLAAIQRLNSAFVLPGEAA